MVSRDKCELCCISPLSIPNPPPLKVRLIQIGPSKVDVNYRQILPGHKESSSPNCLITLGRLALKTKREFPQGSHLGGQASGYGQSVYCSHNGALGLLFV